MEPGLVSLVNYLSNSSIGTKPDQIFASLVDFFSMVLFPTIHHSSSQAKTKFNIWFSTGETKAYSKEIK